MAENHTGSAPYSAYRRKPKAKYHYDGWNELSFEVSGDFALFNDPLLSVGGEQYSYPIPTYEALRGVVSGIYWKPTFQWYIDQVRVMERIRHETHTLRVEQNPGIMLSSRKTKSMPTKHDLVRVSYLRDCRYQVRAHFEWNDATDEYINDRNAVKHGSIARRLLSRGGRCTIFLGTRDCIADVEPCEFGSGTGYYDQMGEISFGCMYHGINYPEDTGKTGEYETRFWYPVMNNGVVDFLPPEQCRILRKSDQAIASR